MHRQGESADDDFWRAHFNHRDVNLNDWRPDDNIVTMPVAAMSMPSPLRHQATGSREQSNDASK